MNIMETLDENQTQLLTDCVEKNESEKTDNTIETVNHFIVEEIKNSLNGKVDDDQNKVGDGNDSGVEFCGSIQVTSTLQRALSSNSGGYASSCGGLEDHNGMISCDSSMISCSSDLAESKPIFQKRIECGTSEGGSESSSVTGGPVTTIRSKKRVGVTESPNKSVNIKRNLINENQRIVKSRSKSVVQTPPSGARNNQNINARERARSRDKFPPKTPINRSASKRPPKPDSFPVDIKEIASPALQRVKGSRTPSATRGRTPGSTPTDDGRWPSVGGKSSTPKQSHENITIKTKIGAISLDNSYTKSSVYDKYATLPRRRKEKSAEDIKSNHSPRSNSITRDSNTRMSNSYIKKQNSINSNVTTPSKSLPAYPRVSMNPKKLVPKTKIYHETSIQTAMTSKDIDEAFLGNIKNIKVEAVDTCTRSTQSDIRDKQIESLEAKLKKLSCDYEKLQSNLSDKSHQISNLEKNLIEERESKLAAQKELHSNSERVLAMLESVYVSSPSNDETDGSDSLLILESQIMKSEHVLEKKEAEIKKWKKLYFDLQNDMEKSLINQKNLIEQRDAIESESNELQDFLQTEKITLVESLREVECDLENYKLKLIQKDSDLERLQEECRHLVRISEQRRHENMGLQSKYSALESRSRELLLQQNNAVSGASVALAGLGSRLDHLVEQLISSYNISEQELEDVIYHNEAYTNSGSSGDGSPEYDITNNENKLNINSCDTGSLSPQRGHSFISAVINAIKNATTSKTNNSMKKMSQSTPANLLSVRDMGDDSDSTEMLDSETEPCLMMENVLEDVTMPDSHSHNLVSTSGMVLSQIEMPSMMKSHHGGESSLHNLLQAIENRQQIEKQSSLMANRSVQQGLIMRQQSDQSTSDDVSIHESIADIPSISDYCTVQTIVDQVIDVDNLVTKLLKVLRIIQMDNDNCIQQLIGEKNKLQLNKEEILERLRELDEANLKLKDQLQDASEKLIQRINELAASKNDLQRHRIEIDRLNEDICNLSTLCSQRIDNSNGFTKDDLFSVLKTWQDDGVLPDPEILNHIMITCNENSKQREQMHINEMTRSLPNAKSLMDFTWHTAVNEAKRQYDAIDRALETLNTIQPIVEQCPALSKLQQELEETNFKAASSLPLSTALLTVSDLNANGNTQTSNIQINGDPNNPTIHTIDSTV